MNDTDGDGIIDEIDLDDDNDGILDTDEGAVVNVDSGVDGAFGIDDGTNDNTGISVESGITSNDAEDPDEAHILDSITINGQIYTDFIVPDAYLASAPDGSQPMPTSGNVQLTVNGTDGVIDSTDPNYGSEILTRAFQNRNLNAYQTVNNEDYSDAAYTLSYDTPVTITGGFIAITERDGNNSATVTALDADGNILGSVTADQNVDYLQLDAQQNAFQDVAMALFALDDLGPVGAEISQLVVTFPDDSLDAPDGKIFIFGDQTLPQDRDSDLDGVADRIDLDSDNDGITDNVETQATGAYIAPSGQGAAMVDANNNGVDDNYEAAPGTPGFNADGIGLAPVNTDGDSNADFNDTDSDDDGIDDVAERGDGGPTNNPTFEDTDGDGLDDEFEGGNASDGYDVNDENVVGDDGGVDGDFTRFNLAGVPALNEDGSNANPPTVDLLFRDVNDTPVAVADEATANSDAPTSIDLTGNDSDPDGDDPEILSIDTTDTLGLVTVDADNDTVAYDPNGAFDALGQGETYVDTFTNILTDGHGGTDTATVSVTVTGVNDPPVAVDDSTVVGQGQNLTIDVLVNDSDPNNDTLMVIDVSDGEFGLTTTINPDGTVTVIFGQAPRDVFTYTISDGRGGTDRTAPVFPESFGLKSQAASS